MDEIATLRSEVEALTTKLAALEARLPPPRSRSQWPISLSWVRPMRTGRYKPCPGFIMPTDKELTCSACVSVSTGRFSTI